MRYFAGFLIFLSVVNLKIGVSNDVTQDVIIFRALQLLLKVAFIVIYSKYFTIKYSWLNFLFISFVLWRVFNISFELESILLSVEFLVNILFLIIYVYWLGINGLRYLVFPLNLLMIYVLLGFIFLPEYFTVELNDGIMLKSTLPAMNPNALGQIGVVCLLCARLKWLRILSFMFVLLSRSRAALFFVLFWIYTRLSRHRKVFLSLVVLFAGMVFGNFLVNYIQRGQDLSTFLTISSRTLIWESALSQFDNHWISGFGSFKGVELLFDKVSADISMDIITLDNGYISLLVEDGMVGLILFLSVCIRALYKMRIYRLEFTLLCFFMYRGFFTSSLILSSNYIFWYLIVLSLFLSNGHEDSPSFE